MIGIIDYGMGNILSVYNALSFLGAHVEIFDTPEGLERAERIVLPGVGAFPDCMANLKQKGFAEALEEAVFENETPILGICLGMQAMAGRSFECGEHEGLGWFEAEVIRLRPNISSLRVPQIGWNEIVYRKKSPLFSGLPEKPDFYFVHSYFMNCKAHGDIDATCDYGGEVTAAVRKNNIFAVQFHPEKSQDYGLKILENFIKWRP
jgi:glutamine amidotransferase